MKIRPTVRQGAKTAPALGRRRRRYGPDRHAHRCLRGLPTRILRAAGLRTTGLATMNPDLPVRIPKWEAGMRRGGQGLSREEVCRRHAKRAYMPIATRWVLTRW